MQLHIDFTSLRCRPTRLHLCSALALCRPRGVSRTCRCRRRRRAQRSPRTFQLLCPLVHTCTSRRRAAVSAGGPGSPRPPARVACPPRASSSHRASCSCNRTRLMRRCSSRALRRARPPPGPPIARPSRRPFCPRAMSRCRRRPATSRLAHHSRRPPLRAPTGSAVTPRKSLYVHVCLFALDARTIDIKI